MCVQVKPLGAPMTRTGACMRILSRQHVVLRAPLHHAATDCRGLSGCDLKPAMNEKNEIAPQQLRAWSPAQRRVEHFNTFYSDLTCSTQHSVAMAAIPKTQTAVQVGSQRQFWATAHHLHA